MLPPIPRPPGYTGKETRVPFLYAVNITTSVVASLFVASRFYVRGWIVKSVGIDDWLILLGLGFMWGECSVAIWAGTLGTGRHVWDVPVENWHSLWQTIIGLQTNYQLAAMCVQLSVLGLYLRLAISIPFRRICYMLAVIVVILTVIRVSYIHCLPNAPGVKKCLVVLTFPQIWMINSSTSIITDSIIWFLPIPMLWRLRTRPKPSIEYSSDTPQLIKKRRRRWGLMITFAFGLCACCATAAKMALRVMDKADAKMDGTWDAVVVQMFDMLELCLAIIGASLPTLQLKRRWKAFRRLWRGESKDAEDREPGHGSHTYTSQRTSVARRPTSPTELSFDGSSSNLREDGMIQLEALQRSAVISSEAQATTGMVNYSHCEDDSLSGVDNHPQPTSMSSPRPLSPCKNPDTHDSAVRFSAESQRRASSPPASPIVGRTSVSIHRASSRISGILSKPFELILEGSRSHAGHEQLPDHLSIMSSTLQEIGGNGGNDCHSE